MKSHPILQKSIATVLSQTLLTCGLTLSVAGILPLALPSAHGAIWDGGPTGTGTDLGLPENWVGDVLPNGALAEPAIFDGSVPGALNLIYATAAAPLAAAPGIRLDITANQMSPLSIDGTVTTSVLRLAPGQTIGIANGAGAFTLGNSLDTFNVTLGGTGEAGTTLQFINNSLNTATINSDVRFGNGLGGTHTIEFTGSGNWASFANMTATNTPGVINVTKLGTGTLNYAGVSSGVTGAVNVGAGTMNLTGNLGTNTSNGNFRVGTVANTPAILNIQEGAVVSRFNLFVGDAGAGTGGGAVYQTGGTVALTQGAGIDNLRIGSNTGGYGYYNLSGGTLTANEFGIGASLADTVGVMTVNGGTASTGGWITVARGGGASSGVLNVDGGTVNAQRVDMMAAATNALALAVVNVADGALNLSGATGLELANGGTTVGVQSVVNLLDGGVLTTATVRATRAENVNALNFDGGTLKAQAVNAGATFLSGANIDRVNVYSGGGTIDNSGTNITVARGLIAPAGAGINADSIPVASGGAGYIGEPLVRFSGGSGTGATGYAVVVGGVVTDIIITSRGTGYLPGETLTATFVAGGASGAALPVENIPVSANASGGMTFTGAGITTLSGVNTYTGPTNVLAGGLTIASTGTLGAGSVNLADTAGVVLTLQNTASFNDNSILNFGTASQIALNFAPGTPDVLSGIIQSNDSQSIPEGIYDAAQLNTFFDVSSFSGTGQVQVVPEPSTVLTLLGGVAMLGLRRRRRA